MRLLLRLTFWLGVILVILPSGRSETPKTAQLNASDAILVASAAASDARAFCDRRPEACITGSQIAVALGYRAQAGAKMIYDFLTDQLGPMETGATSARAHGAAASTPPTPSAPATRASSAVPVSQDTLTPADLEPGWHGPVPRPDRRIGRPA